jgi:DNA-binding HxlR family transcriptional regulator
MEKDRVREIELLGIKKGLIEVLETLKDGKKKRFDDLFHSIGLPAATLALRLKELQVLGLIRKDVENNPGRILIWYQIMDDGMRILNHLLEVEKVLEKNTKN